MTGATTTAGIGALTPDSVSPATSHPDWLYHHLRVTGDPGEVAAFRQAAAGAGIIPWQHDLGAAAEDWFHRLVAPPAPQRRSLSLEGARILAGQLREAAEARQRVVVARAAASRACPFDLHQLLPVPDRLLRLGPDHSEALAWLWAHWGNPPGAARPGRAAGAGPWQAAATRVGAVLDRLLDGRLDPLEGHPGTPPSLAGAADCRAAALR